MAELASGMNYTVLKAVLNLAMDIGREGREGKKVGTAFVIGDTERVLDMSHQIVLNPYEGHRKKDRDVKDEKNWETVKEFAQLDGMFVIDEAGYIVAAGRYLDVNAKDVELPPGLGGRHLAAAAISSAQRPSQSPSPSPAAPSPSIKAEKTYSRSIPEYLSHEI